MSELAILEKLRKMAPPGAGRGVVLGIGDDCSIMRLKPGEDLLITTDLLIEGVHFRLDTHGPGVLGRKALARGLSDIAAMGGEPRACFLSLALPPSLRQNFIDRFYRGLLTLAKDSRTILAGGDLARAAQVMCDIVVCGTVPRGEALRRDKARPGDAIYVSGQLGGASLGLERQTGLAWRRHLSPQPRLRLGRFLRKQLRATAAMDLSDGLSIDLHRLAKAPQVSASIDRPLPVFSSASLEHVLHGGEDYELLFTLKPSTIVPARFEGIPLTRIGTICKGRPGAVSLFGLPLAPLGYDHFRRT